MRVQNGRQLEMFLRDQMCRRKYFRGYAECVNHNHSRVTTLTGAGRRVRMFQPRQTRCIPGIAERVIPTCLLPSNTDAWRMLSNHAPINDAAT